METIKEEKKADLKQLLNGLIKRGRIPFRDKRITNVNWKMQYVGNYNWVFRSNHNVVQFWKSTRELASKESGLWQFVCENGMIEIKWNNWLLNNDDITETADRNIRDKDYQFRLIESSLKDESELEDFLLNSISLHE